MNAHVWIGLALLALYVLVVLVHHEAIPRMRAALSRAWPYTAPTQRREGE